jgi:hypothetical protein
MGVFDKVVKDAEEAMTRDDPGLAWQADQGMQAAQNLIGKQRGARERGDGANQDDGDQDYSDEAW